MSTLTAAENLRGDRILFSIVMQLRAECERLRAAYRFEESNVIWRVIHEELWLVYGQVRADVLNVPKESLTAADVPSCFPGF